MGVLSGAEGGIDKLERADAVFTKGRELLKAMNSKDIESKNIPIHSSLAASYGSHPSEYILQLDEKLQTAIAVVMLNLEKLEDLKWSNVVSAVMSAHVLEPQGIKTSRSSSLTKTDSGWLKFSGAPKPSVVQEVYNWFNNFIKDSDVISDTKINLKFMADIVAQSGAAVTSMAGLIYQHSYLEREFIDVGVLRYPEAVNPKFKIYRIQLKAWADSQRILIHQTDRNGIKGDFTSMIFVPRDSVLKLIRPVFVAKAKAIIKNMFGS